MFDDLSQDQRSKFSFDEILYNETGSFETDEYSDFDLLLLEI